MIPAMCAAIDYALAFPRVVTMIREAGFEVISLGGRPEHSGYDTAAGRERIRRLVGAHGLSIDSVHAPFPQGDRLCSVDEDERVEAVRQCGVAIAAAQDLASGIVVVHLNTSADAGERALMMDQGCRSIASLADTALSRGVRLAVENSWGEAYALVLQRIMTEFPGEPVGFCYDSGHENVNRAGFPELERYGPRLLTVHLHDNCGEDTHLLPYEGDTDWPRLMGLLRGFGYRGNLLFEATVGNSEFQDPAVFLAEARARADRLLENP